MADISSPPGVTLVVLNWNGRHWLEQFLPSLLRTDYPAFEVLLADNASTDDSREWLRAQHPQVRLLALDRNYGFAEGNNRALAEVHTPYYALVNSDVEVDPGWLRPLVELMEAQPDAASVQPKIRAFHARGDFEYAGAAGGWLDRWGYAFCRGRVFDSLESDLGQYDRAAPVFWATGACCLIRKSASDAIGLFDPAFFAHMEEIDFCWRAWNRGYSVWCEPKGLVWHVGGGTLPQGNPRKSFLNARNNLILLIKNLPAGQLWGSLLFRMLLDGVWGLRSLLSGDAKTLGAVLRAHGELYRSLGYWLGQRRALLARASGGRPQGWYGGSIVWDYFIRRKKTFAQIVGPE
jgi:hypothetical protein